MVTNPRRTNGSRRDRIRKRVLAEEDNCHLCGQPVDKTLTMKWGEHGPRCDDDGCPGCVPHMMRAEVDEVIPVSRGGSPYDRDNCRLAHRACNLAKSDGLDAHDDGDAAGAYPLSDCWDGLFATLTG